MFSFISDQLNLAIWTKYGHRNKKYMVLKCLNTHGQRLGIMESKHSSSLLSLLTMYRMNKLCLFTEINRLTFYILFTIRNKKYETH